jgi:hypothetical protein
MHDAETVTRAHEGATDGLEHPDPGPVGERETTEVEDDVAGDVTGVQTRGGELHGADLFELTVDGHRRVAVISVQLASETGSGNGHGAHLTVACVDSRTASCIAVSNGVNER